MREVLLGIDGPGGCWALQIFKVVFRSGHKTWYSWSHWCQHLEVFLITPQQCVRLSPHGMVSMFRSLGCRIPGRDPPKWVGGQASVGTDQKGLSGALGKGAGDCKEAEEVTVVSPVKIPSESPVVRGWRRKPSALSHLVILEGTCFIAWGCKWPMGQEALENSINESCWGRGECEHSKPQTEQWAASLVFLKGWWNYLISEGKALEVTGALSSLQGVSVIAVT